MNIIELGQMDDSNSLVASSIDQKIASLSPFDFRNYFHFRLIRRNSIFLVSSLILLVVFSFAFPGMVSTAGFRLAHFNQVFLKPAPFDFVLLNSNIRVKKGTSIELKVKCVGADSPGNLYVNIGGSNFIMSSADSVFSYRLEHVQNSFPVFFTDLRFSSDRYFVEAVPDPLLLSYKVEVNAPSYTNLPKEEYDDVGNLKVPFGSEIKWKFNCADTDSLFLKIGGELFAAAKNGDSFDFSYKCLKDTKYSVLLSNQFEDRKELISFDIQLVPDLFPDITVVQQQDSVFLSRFYFKGEIVDDYGFHDLYFNIKNIDLDSVFTLPVVPGLNVQDFYYYVDFKDYNSLGISFSYYFTVRDNDYFHSYKQSTSDVFNFQFPDRRELEAANDTFFNDIEDLIGQSKSMVDDINRDLNNLNYRRISGDINDWENQQLMQNIQDKRSKLEETLKQLQDKNAQMNNMNDSFGNQQEALAEKQKQIQQLLDEIMTDELKQLFDELNELADNFNQDRFNEMMDRLDFPMEDLSKQLDRNLEMLKKLKIEQKLTNIASELNGIADKEKVNLEFLEEKDFTQLSEKESSNSEGIEELAKELENVFEMNQQLEKKMNLFPVDKELDNIQLNYKEIQKNIQDKRRNKLQDQLPQNEDAIRGVAFAVNQMLQNNEMQQNGENLANLKQILKNLIYVSLDQEEVLNLTVDLDVNDPLLGVVQNRQDLLLEQSKVIEDSLYALASRTPAVNSKISSELLKIDYSIHQTINDLKEGLINNVPKLQQNTITAYNELALLLNEALENIEKAMANAMPGDQECDKPGQGGKSSMKKLQDAQQSLKDQLQRMIEGLKNGENGQLDQQIGKSLIQQEMMKQMISDLMMDDGIGSSAKEQLRVIEQLIEQNRLDLIQKNISDNMIARQNLILDRLLKAEKSERERDLDDQRESKTADQIFYSNPELIFEYNPKEKNNLDGIMYNDFRLRKFYEEKFRSYINKVNQKD
ncbi:DUF4175 family protein [Mangrovibacterium diazotrophicum]|uniref:DUF4175 family protein n=1 Tax=Mangrovibacterium diazotrophicum TaxID=1261403 RepID=UPI0011C3AFB5|nr:DUF4175 family protein [Mangrovibacterium diazotrophicum]